MFKDNDKPAHWVDHSKLRFLDIDFFKEHQKLMKTRLVKLGIQNKKQILLKIRQMMMMKIQNKLREFIKIRTKFSQYKKRIILWNVHKQ